MAKVLSFLSWNVEHFTNKESRVGRVVDLVAEQDPDVFGIFEVKGAAVYDAVRTKLPDYTCSITESPGVPEILIGVRNGFSAFVTQKDELQSGVPSLRPGALVTVQAGGDAYSFLFLHLKSFPAPRDWGLRDDMFGHVASLKRAIDRAAPGGGPANFVALGDLNTMGLSPAYNNVTDLSAAQELAFVDKRMAASHTGLRRLPKTHEATWWNGKDNWQPAALDHVYASEHLQFADFGGVEVRVIGWVEQPTPAKQRDWIDKYSDHCPIYGEIHK